jgi:hypothetical protein
MVISVRVSAIGGIIFTLSCCVAIFKEEIDVIVDETGRCCGSRKE